jgi:hypothetical protein
MTPLPPAHEWDKIKSEEQLAIRLKNIEQCIADRRAIARESYERRKQRGDPVRSENISPGAKVKTSRVRKWDPCPRCKSRYPLLYLG